MICSVYENELNKLLMMYLNVNQNYLFSVFAVQEITGNAWLISAARSC